MTSSRYNYSQLPISYKVNGENWQLDPESLEVKENSKLEFKAIRIGFKESEIGSL
ncbi:MAG: hypothetical protein KAG37_01410 [Flavobacteriales bacterium]|nr:hypothetical protein [Flavobacteriales bacterium]